MVFRVRDDYLDYMRDKGFIHSLSQSAARCCLYSYVGLLDDEWRVFAISKAGKIYKLVRMNKSTGCFDGVLAYPDTIRRYIKNGELYLLPWLAMDDTGLCDIEVLEKA